MRPAKKSCTACPLPAPTSSSSACRSPIPWPTARRFRPPRCARSRSGHTMKKTLDLVRSFRARDPDTPIVLFGYYNPVYVYPARALPRRRESRRRRRPPHRRPAARGRRGAVPAGHRPRPQLHPPRHADHGRQAAAGGSRQYVGLSLLRLHYRRHRHRRARRGRRARPRRPHQAVDQLPVAVGFGVTTPPRPRPSPPVPTAWWWGRRWLTPYGIAWARRAKSLEKQRPTS